MRVEELWDAFLMTFDLARPVVAPAAVLDHFVLTLSWQKRWRSQYRSGYLTNKQLKGPECSAPARNPVCSCSLRVKSRGDTAMSISVTLLFCFTLWRMGCKGRASFLWHTEKSGTKRSGKEDSGWTLSAEYRYELFPWEEHKPAAYKITDELKAAGLRLCSLVKISQLCFLQNAQQEDFVNQ